MGEGNVCVYVGKMTEETLHATNASAEECGVGDWEGELEDNSKATININDHECNVIDDTKDNLGIICRLEGNDVKVSLRDFGSYVKFNRECLQKGYKCGMLNTYLSAQLFAAPAAGQKRQKLTPMNKLEDSRKKGWRRTVVNFEEHQKRSPRKLGWHLLGCKIQSCIYVSRKNSEQKIDQKNKTWALHKIATYWATDQYIWESTQWYKGYRGMVP